ncbi:SDR family NAD(P)-dependent oxidoreductase [Pseudomarimonas arenosa]|uniref:SDR family NAD(P)-dependent oxidoreductase n=1 Tax=Pseudomarimonas arenosa TaxID=2774145 RepID=A0AAW3ZMK4_9GAMM|nr:SDR family NAD(P)-dependent oxidoreductase [Pseudomarimonas arenosa]MBD8525892.1 SDR family NAD(P)-dependent oxidoreductase [Pseudomarimonas arenosa]
MKDSLLTIYREVAEGRLAQAEALVRIKALKRQASDAAQGVVLATPEWGFAAAASVQAQPVDRIFLWGVDPAVAATLKKARADTQIEAFVPPADVTAADGSFTDAALQGLSAIQSMLAGGRAIRALVLVADETVACGFDAMFRTAMEETPALFARVIRVPSDVDAAELEQIVRDESCTDSPRGAAVRHVREAGSLRREVLRWRVLGQHPEGQTQSAAPVAFKEGGCYLITGGAGGIGLQFAREIVAQCRSARILLAGRSTLTPEGRRSLDALATPRHRIDYVELDVADRNAVDTLVAQLRTEGQPLHGILHCAGILNDGFILRKTPSTFASVLAPKVAGLVNLDLATRDMPLDFILLCSSFAACWGIVGQVDYAAANAFMDAFAEQRNRLAARGERQGRSLSANWPLWQDGGMRMDAATHERLHNHTGMRPLSTASAMRAMYRGFELSAERLLVMEGELSAMRALLAATDSLAHSATRSTSQSKTSSATASAVEAAYATAPQEQETAVASASSMDDVLREKALDYLCRQLSQVLKIPAARLRPQAPLEQYGIDSILAMKLVTHLETIFGRLPKTLAFEYQTIAQLNEYFCTAHAQRLIALLSPPVPAVVVPSRTDPSAKSPFELGPAASATRSLLPGKRKAPPAFDAMQSQPAARITDAANADAVVAMTGIDSPVIDDESMCGVARHHESIAIVGISGRYPDAWDLDHYWRNLSQGVDCIREIPADRWRWQDHYRHPEDGDAPVTGQHSSRWGGFIDGAYEFDPRFFSITPRDAEQIDPQERLFLQHAWMAIEDAGYTRAALQACRGGQVGVYAGVMYGEYNRSGSLASIANRVSYVFDLHGPSMTLDTMCSSSLTAIHLACQDLKQGRTDMALAGGVNLSLHPGKYAMLSAGQFISSDGHCQSFGEGGDGYIPGEGVGVVVLKRLSDALRDGDAIHAVIRGSALNHGGKTNGYTVPNPQAQAAVISAALKDAGVDARQISYIEAHGTGTKLGDPIEIAALSKAFREHTADAGFCLIGSAKSNIGHCESAAGIAGLTKVILQMRHRQIVPSLHSQRLNPNIDFASTPFEVNQRLRPWNAPVIDGREAPLIAGISSFGAGGGNAHLIVEAYAGASRNEHSVSTGPCAVLLSARSLAQLRQKAAALKVFVEANADIDLRDLAYTLQLGREAMDERLAMRVDSRADLIDKLAAFLADESPEDGALADDLYYAQSRRHRESIALFSDDRDLQASVDGWFVAGKLSRLLDIWSKGLNLDWSKLHNAPLPRRMHLPVYPFARERYRREESMDAPVGAGAAQAIHSPLHSLVHRNASKPGQQRYISHFRADDPRITGLRAQGRVILARGLQLEAARAALVDGLDTPAQDPFEPGRAWVLRDVRFGAPRSMPEAIELEIAVLPPGHGLRPEPQVAAFELSAPADGHVLCQGLLDTSAESAAPMLDISALSRAASMLFADRAALIEAQRAIGLEADAPYAVVASVQRAADGLWLTFEPADAANTVFADCAIDPSAVDAAMLAAHWLTPSPDILHLPASFAEMRVHAARGRPRYAWIRRHAATRRNDAPCVDVSLCGDDGAVLIEITALTLLPAVALAAPRSEPTAPAAAAVAAAAPQLAPQPMLRERMPDRRFEGRASQQDHAVHVDVQSGSFAARLQKPGAIALPSTAQIVAGAAATLDKPSLSLSMQGAALRVNGDDQAHSEKTSAASVLLRDRGDGIFALRLPAPEDALNSALVDALRPALTHAAALPSLKALLIESDERVFLGDVEAALDHEATHALLRELAAFPAPTLALLSGAALNTGFQLACACDLVIAVDDQDYGFATAQSGSTAADAATQRDWLAARFGQPLASQLANRDGPLSGRELQAAGWGAVVVSRSEFDATVEKYCSQLADKSADALRLLKQHLAREFAAGFAAAASASDALLQELADSSSAESGAKIDAQSTDNAIETGTLTLASSVIQASVDADGVVLVRLEDRDARNMFSDALIAGLQEVFERIDASLACKVVVLTGYDSYFASGGTRDGLKAIQQGKVRFTDQDVFQLPMRCPLPVIAAMQGHGIGAGWTLGLFCDSVLFSEESRYLSPYMNFGFTPGAGATGILPLRLGFDLARDSLFTGREITGAELARRNPSLTVLPRDRVLDEALALARSIAGHARADLLAWKAARMAPQFEAWQALFTREVAMHETTLVGQADALQRIEQRFAPSQTEPEAAALEAAVGAASRRPPAAMAALPNDVLPIIRRLLAEELRVDEAEIEALTPFVELGLDSISSVTWIGRINAHFGLAIEATKVYSYPNLHTFAKHIGEQLATDAQSGQTADAAVASTAEAPTTSQAAKPQRGSASLSTSVSSAVSIDLGAVRRTLIDLLAQELRQTPDSIDANGSFVDLGLDSISGVTWVRAINQRYDTSIEATRVYTYPTVEQFARLVCDTLAQRVAADAPVAAGPHATAPAATAQPAADSAAIEPFAPSAWPVLVSWRSADLTAVAAPAPAAAIGMHPTEIAVIGMAGRFPMAKDVDSFWDNIVNGRNCISEIPPSRWDTRDYYVEGQPGLGQSNSKWMGVLEGHDRFDPLFFGLSPLEAEAMDPQQRLFLQCCWHGMENAGYTAERLSGSRCGVFVGCAYGDYNLLSRELQVSALGFTGVAASILAARVSYFMNLQGPCVSIDTACSSSLVAIASACDSLVSGASDIALAGGVYVMANADMFLKTASAGMLSPDGRCYTFDQRANGFVPGEGVGVVMLKRLADAERDGDTILGVVRGWGVNQDGRTNGITAPNAESQQRLMRDVYDRFGIDPGRIELVEAHGTGTKLGDPIEIDGLKSAFLQATQPATDRRQYCAIGSVKTNIGHCLTAAGVSGFIKLLLALKHRTLPPSANFETPNEHIDLDASPFFVNTVARDWTSPDGIARHAAISSFGFSGTNAHLVLAEHQPTTPLSTVAVASTMAPDAGCVVPLSARTPEQLLRKAQDLRDLLQSGAASDLAALAYSLQCHRDPMDERLGFVAHSVPDIIDTLGAYIDATAANRPLPPGVFAAHVRQGREGVRLLNEDAGMSALVIDKCIADGNALKLCELWVKGLALDWRRLYGARRPPRVALPPYPFADDAYWVVPSESLAAPTPGRAAAEARHLHPLLQQQIADLSAQGYRPAAHAQDADSVRRTERIHLPTYAFARMHCWLPSEEKPGAANGAATAAPPPDGYLNNLDIIAGLFAELEEETMSAAEVAARVKQLA